MKKKFIFTSLEDEKSREIAEILSNKTARRILDYLSENNATETEIARALNLPASTVNYNIKNLLKHNLIETKEFYWSPKGNKVNVYTSARRMIVIAPRFARGIETLKSIIPIILLSALFLALLVGVIYNYQRQISGGISGQEELKRFSSYDELKNFLKENSEGYYGGGAEVMEMGMAQKTAEAPSAAPSVQGAGAEDYSTTNIQVAGVDEADIVKNDGKYIYAVSGNKVVIVDAFPAENAKIVSEVNLSGTINDIFLNKDKLIIFWQEYYSHPYLYKAGMDVIARRISPPKTFVMIYDISDRQNPVLTRNISFRGNYYDSRMIGDYVYTIINQPVYNFDDRIILPEITADGIAREIKAQDVYYFDIPDESYIFTTIAAINLKEEEISTKTLMMGYTQNMYVSLDNIYITYMKRISSKYYYNRLIDIFIESVPADSAEKIRTIKDSNESIYKKMQDAGEIIEGYADTLETEARLKFQNDVQDRMEKLEEEIAKETEKTIIQKIAINRDSIEHKATGEVPGNVLNQFSMDEYNENLRIATTTQNWRAGEESKNNLYVLNKDLGIVGKIEGLAEGERIYSARFLQDKAYMVTFRQIDPLFVIDLKNPEEPKVLGYLKIPGVSDYLHPYDETHVIGVGRDATEEGRITGMKLSLFDVTDVENPKEISKYIIGGRGTSSEALTDHKAFLFSKEKNLLVIPVTTYDNYRYNWNGAYVFSVDLENGFQLKGKITHENESINKSEYYYDWQSNVRRSLYMENTLYTISQKMIKANSLDDMNEISEVVLSTTEEKFYPLME